MSFWGIFTVLYILLTPLMYILVKTEQRGIGHQIAWIILYLVPISCALFIK